MWGSLALAQNTFILEDIWNNIHVNVWNRDTREHVFSMFFPSHVIVPFRSIIPSRQILFVSCCLEIFIIILCCNCFVFVILRYHGIYRWHHVLSCISGLKPHPQLIQWLYTISGLKPHHQHTRNDYGNVLFVIYKMFVRWVLFQACENQGNGVNMPFDNALLKHVISVICHYKI